MTGGLEQQQRGALQDALRQLCLVQSYGQRRPSDSAGACMSGLPLEASHMPMLLKNLLNRTAAPLGLTLRLVVQRGALEDALRQLYLLDALDSDGCVTALGRTMSCLPLEPSLARSLLAAVDLDCLPDAITVAAMLSAESIFAGNRWAPVPARCAPCFLLCSS